MRTKFRNPHKFMNIQRTPGVSPGAVLEMLQRGQQGKREAQEAAMLNTSGLMTSLFNEVELPEGHQASIAEEMSKIDREYSDQVKSVNDMFTPEALALKRKAIQMASKGNYAEASKRYEANMKDWEKAKPKVANQLAVQDGKVAVELPDGRMEQLSFDEYASLPPEVKGKVKLLNNQDAFQTFMRSDTHNSGEYLSMSNRESAKEVFDRMLDRFSVGKTANEQETLASLGEKLGNPQLAQYIVKWKQGQSSNGDQLRAVQKSLLKGGMMSQAEIDALQGHYAQKLISQGQEPTSQNIHGMFMDDLSGVAQGKLDLATDTGFTSANSIFGDGNGKPGDAKVHSITAAMNGWGHKIEGNIAFGDSPTSTVGVFTKIPALTHVTQDGKRANLVNGELSRIGDVSKVYTAQGQRLPKGADKNTTYDADKAYAAYFPVDRDGNPITDYVNSPAYKNNPQVQQLFRDIQSLDRDTSEAAQAELAKKVAELNQNHQNVGKFVVFNGVYRDTEHQIADGDYTDISPDFLDGKRITDKGSLAEYVSTWDGDPADYNDEYAFTENVYPGESHGLYEFTMMVPAYNSQYVDAQYNTTRNLSSPTEQLMNREDTTGRTIFESGGKLLEGQQKLPKFEQGGVLQGIKFINVDDLM